MKNNKDYSEIENILSEKADKLESSVKYSGAVRGMEKNDAKSEKKERRGFDFPGKQLVAAVLAMVIVGAGTFTGLKYLERIGAQRLQQQGSAGNNAADGTNDKNGTEPIAYAESVADVVTEPVEYDPKYDSFGGDYLYLKSGDKVFSPFIYPLASMKMIDYTAPTFTYSGKLELVNNVKDREFTVLLADINFDGETSYDREFRTADVNELFDFIENSAYSSRYEITIQLTWDDPDRSDAKIYYVDFYVQKNEVSDKFEDVVRFDIDYTDNKDAHKLALPLDHTYSNVQEVKCEAAEALGYSIYWYNSAALECDSIYTCVCILDENDKLVFDYQMKEYSNTILSEIWYARQTPSDHPMMFFLTSQLISSNGWVYSNLYAFDVTTKEEYLVISVGPEPHHSQSNLQVYGALSYENERMIVHYYDDLPRNIMNPYDKETWPDDPFAELPIKWNGEKYVVEGIDAGRLSEEFANANKTEEQIKEEQLKAKTEEEANSRLYVTASGAEYYPVLINAEIFEDNKEYHFEYDNEPTLIEYSEPFEIRNGIRKLWTIPGIDAGNAGFADIDTFTEYLHKLSGSVTEDTSLDVTICVSFNNDNMYTYAFKLHIKANEGGQQTEVEPSGYAKFAVIVDKYAISPYEYKEYDKSEANEVNVTVNPAPDVIPVIDVYALGEYETIKYSYDTEAVTHVETRMGAYSGGTVLYSSPGSILTDARSMLRVPGASNVLYVESVFQKKDGSGKYISYIFAVSGGDPACYPFSSDGDGAARFTVSDDNNTYAPRAKYFYCSDRSVIENSRFTELNLQYYNVPTVVLTGSLEFRMKDGYHISKVIAFKDTKATEQNVYNGIEGLHLSTWLSKQPWGEFYAAVIVDKDGEESDEGNGYLTAYVFRVVLASPSSSPETVEQIQTVDHSAQVEELQSWLSQRMWEGMTEEELLNMAAEEKDLKNAILAAAPEQINQEDDGTFVRYKTEYCDFLYFAEKDTRKIREARMILHPGTTFRLPFGLALDMTPEKALLTMGYAEQEIESLKDKTVTTESYSISYHDGSLTVTFNCGGAYLGIELGGESQAYIEMG